MVCNTGNLDVRFVQGDDIRLGILALEADGTAIDLTGQSIEYQMKNYAGTTVIQKSTPLGIEVPDPETGLFYVILPAAETANLSGKYTHAARLTDGDGKDATLTNKDLSPGEVWVQKAQIT